MGILNLWKVLKCFRSLLLFMSGIIRTIKCIFIALIYGDANNKQNGHLSTTDKPVWHHKHLIYLYDIEFEKKNICYFLLICIGLAYYLNVYTKESQWELPTSPAKPDGSSKDPSQVQCAHLLVKHKNSRRPSSWREENITRTKDEARTILNGYYQKVSFQPNKLLRPFCLHPIQFNCFELLWFNCRLSPAMQLWPNWHKSTQTVVQPNGVEIWAHFHVVKCKSHSKRWHSIWKSAKYPTLPKLIPVCTSLNVSNKDSCIAELLLFACKSHIQS